MQRWEVIIAVRDQTGQWDELESMRVKMKHVSLTSYNLTRDCSTCFMVNILCK